MNPGRFDSRSVGLQAALISVVAADHNYRLTATFFKELFIKMLFYF